MYINLKPVPKFIMLVILALSVSNSRMNAPYELFYFGDEMVKL